MLTLEMGMNWGFRTMPGIYTFLAVIVWMLLGTIPLRLLWYHAFKEQPNKLLVVVSAIFGPILGVVHIVGWSLVMLIRLYDY
jgi:hypothetical protein